MEGGEILDLQKIGLFLKELRKEQKLTQEQLAEKFNVSRRTVSRWENGNNLPDLDILIDMSDFYQVDLREILDGERKNEQMNKETEAVVLKAVDYTNTNLYFKEFIPRLVERVLTYSGNSTEAKQYIVQTKIQKQFYFML